MGDVADTQQQDRPVAARERIVKLDFIRGIAVLGILFANIVALGHPMLAYFWPPGLPGGARAFDEGVWLVQQVTIDGKFRGLFTLLFGAGMMLFVERAWARGATRWLQARRLVWLGLFGLAHYYLLFTGDILFLYAIGGLIALPMVTWTAKRQLRVGLAWYLVGTLLLSVLMGGQAALENVPEAQRNAPEQYQEVLTGNADMLTEAREEGAVMAGGSYAEIVAYRLREGNSMYFESAFFALIETVPLMLIGMALFRMGLFERGFDRAAMRRWGWIGVIGGAALTLPLGLAVMGAGFPMMLTMAMLAGPTAFLHLPMVLGLAALLSLWAPSATQTWLGARFAAAGRMAFSNYIACSTIGMLVFQGWAGGLYGELHRGGLLLVVLAMWALMLAWSKPWLDRFDYGPLEWLWRCLTYWRVFPFRRTVRV